uniref:Frizzled-4 n=1 Tax=Caenorhabditis japonica TaxID=281687 RepID=A0A8R1DZV5_CAEJA
MVEKLVEWKCPTDEVFLNRSAKCVPLCSNPQKIGQADRDASSKYLLFLALSSVILTILSVFVVSLSFYFRRLEVLSSLPETAMFFSSLAFCVTSAIYILSVAFKDQLQISCTDYTHHLLFVVDGLSHVPCSSVASLIYYSATCSRLWWLLLCFSWNKATRTAHILDESLTRVVMLILGLPLAPLMLALLAKAVAANPLTGLCFIGAASSATDWFFNFCRELVLFLISSIALSSACCRLLGSQDQEVNGFAGVIAALYPVSALFYMLSFINDATQPNLDWDRSFNAVSATKYCFDLVLSFIMCAFCFIFFLTRVARSSSKVSKEGYQPAVPKLPQPAIPGSIRSNTYASTFRTHNMI